GRLGAGAGRQGDGRRAGERDAVGGRGVARAAGQVVGGVLVREAGRGDVGDAAVRPAGPDAERGRVGVVEAGAAAGEAAGAVGAVVIPGGGHGEVFEVNHLAAGGGGETDDD